MSEAGPGVTGAISAAGLTPSDPRAAIARAAQATGEDFGYLLAQARIESGLNPSARAATSSAAGLYQFTRQTWFDTLDRHGAAHGLGWASAAIENGRIADPALRSQILALRFDPEVSARMAAEFAGDNRAALETTLGRSPDQAELYLAHFLGAEGASRFLSALAADPAQSAAALMPAAAAANRAIFYQRGGEARSLDAVMELVRGKVAAAGGDAIPPEPGGQPAPSFAGVAAPVAPVSQRPRSMADTLAATFGAANEAPAGVRAAYGRLKAFGL